MTDLQIEYRAIDALIPHARNAKQHTDAQVAQIAASIREFGWGAPILVDGQNNVVAGHGRLLAARKLGLTQVPVVPMNHLTDIQRRALILADNKIGENAAWDTELLTLELKELEDAGFDLNCHEGRPTPPSMKTVSLCCAVGASEVRLKGRSPEAPGPTAYPCDAWWLYLPWAVSCSRNIRQSGVRVDRGGSS